MRDFWIWLAGFYEGEGTVMLKGPSHSLGIEISQKKTEVLKFIQSKINGHIITSVMDKNTGRQQSRIQWSGDCARYIAKQILPHMHCPHRITSLKKALKHTPRPYKTKSFDELIHKIDLSNRS